MPVSLFKNKAVPKEHATVVYKYIISDLSGFYKTNLACRSEEPLSDILFQNI